jgi:hypothetical protein
MRKARIFCFEKNRFSGSGRMHRFLFPSQGYVDQLTITNQVKSSCEIYEDATLAACFTFDNGSPLVDSGANSLVGTTQSTSFVSSGHSLQAISFNGSTSSYFQVSSLTGLGTINKSFSLSLWIRPRNLSGTLVHVSATASGLGWCVPFIGFAANGSLVAQMWNNGFVFVLSPSAPSLSVWTHVVQTWSSANGICLYVEGVLVASNLLSAASYIASSTSDYVTLANTLSGYNNCQPGHVSTTAPCNTDIDDFRVYSRELTASEVYTIYSI